MSPTILHVEDNASDVDLLRFAWDETGHPARLVAVRNCVEAEAHLERSAAENSLPELILLDLNLPGCHGTDLLVHLRAQGCRIPVVVLTSSSNPRDRHRCTELGAVAYLTKACTYAELREQVQQVATFIPNRGTTG